MASVLAHYGSCSSLTGSIVTVLFLLMGLGFRMSVCVGGQMIMLEFKGVMLLFHNAFFALPLWSICSREQSCSNASSHVQNTP